MALYGRALALRDELRCQVFQCRRQCLAARVPVALRRMAHGGDAGRLLDDDEMLIEMADNKGLIGARFRRRSRQQFDGFAFFEAARGIETQLAVDADRRVSTRRRT